jgi:hypothetical protein
MRPAGGAPPATGVSCVVVCALTAITL